MTETPKAAMLVIGDEILSGRTRDANMYHLAGQLTEHGLPLCEVRVVSDEMEAIIKAVQDLSASYTHVFTSGGIGPTHDDITADAVAAAFGLPLDVRDDARALLAAHYEASGKEFNAARQRMARIPEGAELIANPVSVAPGFSLKNVHVMAGVPKVFNAMLEDLLPRLSGGAKTLSITVAVARPEGELAGPLGDIAQAFPDLSFGSYPFIREGGIYGAELVVRGTDPARLAEAEAELQKLAPTP